MFVLNRADPTFHSLPWLVLVAAWRVNAGAAGLLRAEVRNGSFATDQAHAENRAVSEMSGRKASDWHLSRWASFGLVHSKQHHYSITSSARPSSESGTVIPSALAVLRLMI